MRKLSFLFIFMIAQLAFAQLPANVYVNDRGMPKLIVNPENPSKGWLISWDIHNHYERKVYSTEVNVKTYLSLSDSQREQEEWKVLTSKWSIFCGAICARKKEINLEAGFIGQMPLDVETKAALEQIRYGANEFRTETNVADYIQKTGLTEQKFTLELNREMTEKYGAGFTVAVYGHLIKNDPTNSRTMQEVKVLFDKRLQGHGQTMQEVMKGVKIVVVKGYMQTLRMDLTTDVESLDALVNDLRKMNIDIEILTTSTGDPVHENAIKIAEQLKKRLQDGEKIVLLGVSKGVPEVLGGLAEMNAQGFFEQGHKGKILGVLLGSGVLGGSMVADFLNRFPIYVMARPFLGKLSKMAQMPVEDFRGGIASLSRDYLDKYMSYIEGNIPRSLYYLDFIGVTNPKTGFANNKEVQMLQKKLMTKKIFGVHGANDGLAEYPGLGLKRELAPNGAKIIFDSDHSILPGTLDGISFREVENRNTGMSALIEYLVNKDKNSIRKCSAVF